MEAEQNATRRPSALVRYGIFFRLITRRRCGRLLDVNDTLTENSAYPRLALLNCGLFVPSQQLHERFLQLSILNTAVLSYVQPREEALVHHAPGGWFGHFVQPGTVLSNVQRSFELLVKIGQRQPGGCLCRLSIVQFAGQAIHFALEHVERDGTDVVGFKQLGPFPLNLLLLLLGTSNVASRRIPAAGQFFSDHSPDLVGSFLAEL
ncbi:hypothetical protein [Antrihabitans stalactiti]|uniref:Uncharacterized protein n=1 Tax=Antrihabitans stalactiti TaxID=2584121 RepID=A0A848KKQ0_9NOCA|nr:hypothetical protein [Antrihabitans stalactiti]NMN98448.1 hypothetical protein [Antrihabitans stalactiti]